MKNIIIALLERNNLMHGFVRIRLTISLGIGALNHMETSSAWTWITASPVSESSDPIRVTSAPWHRDQENVLRGLKIGSYAEHLIALDLARREGFDEMLFFNHHNELCEAAMANVFLIRSGKIFTPPLDSGCLAGITRSFLLRLAAEKKIPYREKPLKRADLHKADCIFLTSSIRGPMRVSSYENRFYDANPLFDELRIGWLSEMKKGDI